MRLGIGLPNTMAHETDRALMLDWARTAEEAGFAYLSTIDKPNYDAWDPLVTLAGVAGVTERIGLATTILFGTAGSAAMKEAAPRIREAFAKEGKEDITVAGLAYVAVGDDPQAALAEGAHHVLRYYGRLWTEPGNLIHHGPAAKIAEEIAAYDGAVDVLIVFPQIPSLDQVEELAEHVLPAYRTEAIAVR